MRTCLGTQNLLQNHLQKGLEHMGVFFFLEQTAHCRFLVRGVYKESTIPEGLNFLNGEFFDFQGPRNKESKHENHHFHTMFC